MLILNPDTDKAVGWVTVAPVVAWHPFVSLTVTVYTVPADKPVAVAVFCPGTVFQA